jgi:hypothetical protein
MDVHRLPVGRPSASNHTVRGDAGGLFFERHGMKLIVDAEGYKAIQGLCDIALRYGGLANMQAVNTILCSTVVEGVCNVNSPGDSGDDGQSAPEGS